MYWEPHTSSIDFCESNYQHMTGVVEFHNSWSSLFGISLFGLIGMMYNNPTQERRTTLAFLILFLIGLGSTGLHLSMHWIFQSSDELPMLYLSDMFHFLTLEYNAPLGKPNYPKLPYIIATLMVVHTIIYYRFQGYFWIFFFTYTSGVVVHMILGYNIIYKQKDVRTHTSHYFYHMALLVYLGGWCFWLFDMFACDTVLSVVDDIPKSYGLLRGVTPHIVWHIGAAFGTYLAICCAITCRMEEIKKPFHLEYLFGIVPIIQSGPGQKRL